MSKKVTVAHISRRARTFQKLTEFDTDDAPGVPNPTLSKPKISAFTVKMKHFGDAEELRRAIDSVL